MSPLKFGCVYLVVKNIKKSAKFYCTLLNTTIDKKFEDRWVQIKSSNEFTIGLLRADYDIEKIKTGSGLDSHYNQSFIDNLQQKFIVGNTTVINLSSNEFQKDYERIKANWPDKTSAIQYVNFMFPYYFFTITDPDGHVVEIADS